MLTAASVRNYPHSSTTHDSPPTTRSLHTPHSIAHYTLHTPAHPLPDDRVATGITPLWKRKSNLAILSLARHPTVDERLDLRTPSKNFANPTDSTTGCSCRQSDLTCVCVRRVLQLVSGLLYNSCLICSTSGFCFRLNDVLPVSDLLARISKFHFLLDRKCMNFTRIEMRKEKKKRTHPEKKSDSQKQKEKTNEKQKERNIKS
jgi:hypothetical protein